MEYAPGYTVTLYGDNKVVKRMTVESNSANLAEFMEDMDKTYYYEVKAVPITADEKKYLKEGQYVSSTSQEFDWETYEEEEKDHRDRTMEGNLRGIPTLCLMEAGRPIPGKRFQASGISLTAAESGLKGWVQTGGRWYYMDQNGAMCTAGFHLTAIPGINLNEKGEMQTAGWQPSPGSCTI